MDCTIVISIGIIFIPAYSIIAACLYYAVVKYNSYEASIISLLSNQYPQSTQHTIQSVEVDNISTNRVGNNNINDIIDIIGTIISNRIKD